MSFKPFPTLDGDHATFPGNITVTGNILSGGSNLHSVFQDTFASNANLNSYLPLSGGTLTGSLTTARPLLVNGAHDNGGTADFAVDGGTQISFHDGQVQMGGLDMNWTAKFYYNSSVGTNIAAWDNNITIFSTGSNTGTAAARDIIFSPQTSGTGYSTERMRIKGSGNVGIGVTDPDQKLEVNGNAHISYSLLGRGIRSSNRGELHLNATGADDVSEIFFGYGDGYAENNIRWGLSDRGCTNGQLHLYKGPAIGGFGAIQSWDESGKVGIGTTAPTQLLTLYTPSGDTNLLISSNTGASQIFFGDTESDNIGKIDYDHSDNSLNFVVNAAERMRITNGGNVGIGTTSPASKLEVDGQVRVVGAQMIGDSATSNVVASGVQLHIKNTGEAKIRLEDSDSDNLAFDILVNEGSGFSIKETVGGDSGDDTRLVIQETTGNVGIGTSSPDSLLHIADTTTMTSGQSSVEVVKLQRIDSAGDIKASTEGHISMWATDGNSDEEWARISWLNDNSSDSGAENEGSLHFWTNNAGVVSRALSINHDQNVGIGTISPSDKLHVVGNITTSGVSSICAAYNSSNFMKIEGNTSGGTLVGYDGGVHTTMIRSYGDSFLNGGNLGIGDSTPSYKLDVDGTVRSTGQALFQHGDCTSGLSSTPSAIFGTQGTKAGTIKLESCNNGSSYSLIQHTNSNTHIDNVGGYLYLNWYDGDGIYVHTDSRIMRNGNWGIGTTTPAKQLHVRGSAPFIRIEEDSASNKRLDLWVDPSTAIAFVGANQSAQQLSFQTCNTDRIRIANGGNVGIGTTSPAAKLDVNGSICANAGYFGSSGNNPQIRLYTEDATTNIADTFTDTTTDKSYIYFAQGPSSNDPGYIMHETSDSETNEGVIHLAPSDDNADSDYVSIHGTNDVDALRLTTAGLIETASSYQLRLQSGSGNVKVNDNFEVTGNVGIGIATPNSKLDVNSGISSSSTDVINLSQATTGAIKAAASLGIAIQNSGESTNAADLYFRTASAGSLAEHMRITSGGNVGIGDSTPSYKLDVCGTLRTTGEANFNSNVNVTGDLKMIGTDSYIWSPNTSGGYTGFWDQANARLAMQYRNSYGGWGIMGAAANGVALKVYGTSTTTGDATFDSDVTIGGNLTINGTTTTVNSTTVQVDDKNIELGTVASPTDTTADGGGITLKGTTDKTINWYDASDAWTFSDRIAVPDGTAGAPALTFTDDTDTGIYRSDDDVLRIATGGGWRAMFNSSGISSVANLYTADSGQFRNFGGVWKATTGTTGNGFQFISADATALTISSTGDVVASGKITSGDDIVNATAGVYTWTGDTDTYIQRSAANEMTFKTLATNALVLDSSQNATFGGSIKTEGPDGGMVMRTWTDTGYGMIGTANMSGQEYALLTNGTHTYIGAGAGGNTYIRSNSNDSSPQIQVQSSNIVFNGIPSKASESTALVWDGSGNVGYRELGSNAFNSTAIPSAANNATITLQGGGGITTTIGDFTTDQSSNETLTISHADTSGQSTVSNSNGTVIQGVTLDTYGHVTYLASANLDNRYPRGKTVVFNSVDTDNGTDDWYKLFRVEDQASTPVEAHLAGYAHTSISFIVSEGYQGGSAHINILDAHVNSVNGSYKYIEGVRVFDNGDVEVKLNGGSNVSLELTVIGDATVVSQPTLSTNTGTVRDSITSLSTGMIRSYGSMKATEIELSNISAAASDTDKFLVSDGGIVKYRTGTQVRSDIGAQAAGTYNTIIGTDTDVDTSGCTIIDNIYVTDGVITSMGTRNLTLADLGYTGATNANNYTHPTHPGDDINIDTGALTGATVISDLDFNITTDTCGHVTDANAAISTRNITASDIGATPLDHIRSLGAQSFTAGGGSNSSITTAQLICEMEGDGAFDSYTSVFKTSWSYASNDNLSDAGRFTETAGTSWITWTDNSSDSVRGCITALAIAPTTGGSAGGVYIYNDQGSGYDPGWREVWTSATDGSGSGLDADKLDGCHASAFQAAGTYNTIIGTDTDINTSGCTIIDNIYVTDGVITSMGTRNLTLADLGYTGATNANNYSHPTHPGDDINIDSGALTGATVISDIDINVTTDTLGHVTDANGTIATRTLTPANLGISAPNAPSNVSVSVVGETVSVSFDASTTSDIDSYLVYSSVDGSDYGLISIIPPDDFSATMEIIDQAFAVTGTQAYRVYAMKYGIMSSAATGSVSYTVSTAEPTDMTVVPLNNAYFVQWNPPSSNERFVTAYNVYKHEASASASLSRASASLVYSGLNTNYMYQISGNNNNNYHQFWVETTIA